MSVKWFDGFELATAAAINARYTSGGVSAVGSSGGRTGQWADLGGSGLTKDIPAVAGLVIGFAWVSGTAEVDFLRLYDSASSVQLTLRQNTDGTISLWRGAAGSGTLLATSPAISPGFWVYYELRIVVSDTVGEYEFRANEVTQFIGAGADTKATANANIARVELWSRFTNGGFTGTAKVDDFYIADLTSPKPVGDFLGNLKIEHRAPSGAGSSSDFTPSAGSNYQCVDDNPHNGDTDYVHSSNVGDTDTYAMQDMAAAAGQVRGVQVTAVARKDDALARSLAIVARSGGTDYEGDAQALSTSYAHYYQRYDLDPDTDLPWDLAGVNALEAGIKLVA